MSEIWGGERGSHPTDHSHYNSKQEPYVCMYELKEGREQGEKKRKGYLRVLRCLSNRAMISEKVGRSPGSAAQQALMREAMAGGVPVGMVGRYPSLITFITTSMLDSSV